MPTREDFLQFARDLPPTPLQTDPNATGAASMGNALNVLFAIGQEREKRKRMAAAMTQYQGQPGVQIQQTFDERGFPVPTISQETPGPQTGDDLLKSIQAERLRQMMAGGGLGELPMGQGGGEGAAVMEGFPGGMTGQSGAGTGQWEVTKLNQYGLPEGYERKEPDVGALYSQERTSRTRDFIKLAREGANEGTTGFFGGASRNWWGGPANDLRVNLESLGSSIAFNEIAEMRAASKTGGALGAISERELALLKAALGAIDQTQSTEQFLKSLTAIEGVLDRWDKAKGRLGAPAAASAGAAPASAGTGSQQVGRFLVEVE